MAEYDHEKIDLWIKTGVPPIPMSTIRTHRKVTTNTEITLDDYVIDDDKTSLTLYRRRRKTPGFSRGEHRKMTHRSTIGFAIAQTLNWQF